MSEAWNVLLSKEGFRATKLLLGGTSAAGFGAPKHCRSKACRAGRDF